MLFISASAQTVCTKAIALLKIKCCLSTQVLKLFFLIYTALKSALYASTNIFAHVSQGINFLKCIFYVIFHINNTSWFLALNFVLEYSPKEKNPLGSSPLNVPANQLDLFVQSISTEIMDSRTPLK